MKKLPNSYRVTEADNEEAKKLYWNKTTHVEIMQKHDYRALIISAFVKAGEMKLQSGVWPTLGEVFAEWDKENQIRERDRERFLQKYENEKQKQTTT